MTSIEQEAKDRFLVYFSKSDWERFKSVAEYYFQRAVFYKKSSIDYKFTTNGTDALLLARNIQKRLDIGIGVELIVKSFYLKEGYLINLIKDKRNRMSEFPFKQSSNHDDFHIDNTFTLNDLIQNLNKVKNFENMKEIDEGFRVAKVFRNKEGHVVTKRHDYDASEYTRIEKALSSFYKEVFKQILNVQFSMESGEEGIWKLTD